MKSGVTYTFSFSEDEFEVTTENSWERFYYAQCYGYVEDSEFLFIQPSKNSFFSLEIKIATLSATGVSETEIHLSSAGQTRKQRLEAKKKLNSRKVNTPFF